jgi:hypothetical protein
MSKNIAIIIHTCDKYNFLWAGWRHYFQKYWDPAIESPIFFCSETLTTAPDMEGPFAWFHILTGKGEWGERLHKILDSLPTEIDTVFYMQEDFWLHRTLPAHVFQSRYETFKKWNMDAYRCCAPSKHFKFRGKYPPRHYAPDSPYLVTHQASFWKKDFFRSCVLPHEDPWQNEKEGTKRLIKAGRDHRIYFAPYSFYHTVCQKGKLTDLGRELDAQAKA